MNFANLPAHDLAMDEPAPSKIVRCPDGSIAYGWVMTDTERAHISDMLAIDHSEIKIGPNIMKQERSVCRGCGKHSGLDDLVHNALYAGVHCTAFMVDVLANGPAGPSPAHDLVCSRCTIKYEGSFDWSSNVLHW